ncbi:hypothetical protein CRENBAI_016826 [Crenichthys baileyi]|uniref:Uncharacterized protein n=1 Tax=Crenichthys baileyi TaxID=28760 RepID=A0AAV9RF35_9TELE
MHRLMQWFIFICYPWTVPISFILLHVTLIVHPQTSSQDFISFSGLMARLQPGKKALFYSAPSTWTALQQDLRPSMLIPLRGLFIRYRRSFLPTAISVCNGSLKKPAEYELQHLISLWD